MQQHCQLKIFLGPRTPTTVLVRFSFYHQTELSWQKFDILAPIFGEDPPNFYSTF